MEAKVCFSCLTFSKGNKHANITNELYYRSCHTFVQLAPFKISLLAESMSIHWSKIVKKLKLNLVQNDKIKNDLQEVAKPQQNKMEAGY